MGSKRQEDGVGSQCVVQSQAPEEGDRRHGAASRGRAAIVVRLPLARRT